MARAVARQLRHEAELAIEVGLSRLGQSTLARLTGFPVFLISKLQHGRSRSAPGCAESIA